MRQRQSHNKCVEVTGLKRTAGMSFISRGPNHPISEFATSHVYRLKKTRNEGDLKLHVFLIKRVRIQCYIYSECPVVEWLY